VTKYWQSARTGFKVKTYHLEPGDHARAIFIINYKQLIIMGMGFISWIVLGLIAGYVAKFFMPGKDPGGCIITTILGILGATVGGWVGTLLNFGTVDAFNFKGLAISVVGAVLLLLAYRLVFNKKA
jgi:uncharacterized membrane protein YeaQ/YmgE (transglycosylase-associated protein family)